jgi:hypothetical protein
MARARTIKRLRPYLPDSIELWFGLLPWLTGYAAFVSWADLIVRAIRGEKVKEDWRLFASSGAFIAARTLVSGTHIREAAALRGAAVEMRELVRDATAEAQRRNQLAEARDRRDLERQARLYKLTVWLVALAALTLATAIVALVVSIIQ